MFKKILFLLSCYLFVNCSDTTNLANCIRTLPISLVTDLNNPEMINAQTPGGFAELSGGRKGILLFNKNGNDFVALRCAVADAVEKRLWLQASALLMTSKQNRLLLR